MAKKEKVVEKLSLHLQFRKDIGENLQKLIQDKKPEGGGVRTIDSLTRKDSSWINKVFNGHMNFTIDSLAVLMMNYKIDPKDVFNVEIKYDRLSERQMNEYLLSLQKTKSPKVVAKKKATIIKKPTVKKK